MPGGKPREPRRPQIGGQRGMGRWVLGKHGQFVLFALRLEGVKNALRHAAIQAACRPMRQLRRHGDKAIQRHAMGCRAALRHLRQASDRRARQARQNKRAAMRTLDGIQVLPWFGHARRVS